VTAAANIAAILKQAGQRPTPQRLMILSVLAEAGDHISAEAIHERVQGSYPYLNLSTVYRTLELFRDRGIISETDLGGGVRQFELLGHPHHHLICLQCGAITELAAVVLAPIKAWLLAEQGFEARLDHLAIFGYCRDCRTQTH
jgi:Fur family ferric uptake transcriptional regulator